MRFAAQCMNEAWHTLRILFQSRRHSKLWPCPRCLSSFKWPLSSSTEGDMVEHKHTFTTFWRLDSCVSLPNKSLFLPSFLLFQQISIDELENAEVLILLFLFCFVFNVPWWCLHDTLPVSLVPCPLVSAFSVWLCVVCLLEWAGLVLSVSVFPSRMFVICPWISQHSSR